MATCELDSHVAGGGEGHQVDPPDVKRVEQLDERIGLLLRRAANRDWRTVIARTRTLNDREPVLGQPLVAEVRLTG